MKEEKKREKTKLDKAKILERIKAHFHLKTNAELARFLGISPSLLSNWYSRNAIDFELILTKCADIDVGWLLKGESVLMYPEVGNIEALKSAASPLIKHLSEFYHPHAIAVVTGNTVHIWDGLSAVYVDEFLVDNKKQK